MYSHSASQETPCLLWNLEVHYCVHNSLPLVHILSQMNSVSNLTPYFTVDQIYSQSLHF
jgi:hypothetical protein